LVKYLEEDNLSQWFKAGVISVGIGSSLFTKEVLAQKDWNGIAEKVAAALAFIKGVRKQ
jgi:2-dehydro-3-deoxyphosphogluconate aldolase/(4S)-4-hydroxy-2-oxoglutarate aldolase